MTFTYINNLSWPFQIAPSSVIPIEVCHPTNRVGYHLWGGDPNPVWISYSCKWKLWVETIFSLVHNGYSRCHKFFLLLLLLTTKKKFTHKFIRLKLTWRKRQFPWRILIDGSEFWLKLKWVNSLLCERKGNLAMKKVLEMPALMSHRSEHLQQ